MQNDAMIDTYLSISLQEIITDRIKQQCRRYRQLQTHASTVYYELYANRRGKYPVTAAVLSGFAPDRFAMNGITVTDLGYGLSANKLFQPELITDTAIIQFYSKSAKPYQNIIVQERCRQHNCSGPGQKKFLLVRFWVDKHGNLSKIEAQLPDADCVIRETKVLYKKPVIALRASNE